MKKSEKQLKEKPTQLYTETKIKKGKQIKKNSIITDNTKIIYGDKDMAEILALQFVRYANEKYDAGLLYIGKSHDKKTDD